MPAVSAHVPKYCHFKPRDLAYVRIRGQVRYLGKYGTPESRERYRRALAELEATAGIDRTAAAAEAGGDLTIIEICAAYLDFAEGYYVKDGRPTDQMGNVRRAIKMAKDLYGETPAREFGPLALRAVQEHMVTTPAIHPRTKRTIRYSRSTINSTCGCIERIFKWAASHELLPATIPQALATVPGLKKGRTAAREPRPVLPVADELVERTLPHLPPVVSDMVRFQRLTGARPGEVCSLRPVDVDRCGDVWEYRPAGHKTEHEGRERIVFIGPRAQEVLLPYLLRPMHARCFSPADSERKRRAEQRAERKTRVQPSQRDRRKARPQRAPSERYTRDAYRRAIAKAIGKANRKDAQEAAEQGREPDPIAVWHPNQLRHAAATEIRRRYGLEAAQTVLGHAKADVTQVYAERDQARAAGVMREIG